MNNNEQTKKSKGNQSKQQNQLKAKKPYKIVDKKAKHRTQKKRHIETMNKQTN